MTTTLTATFDGKVLIPEDKLDLPQGEVLRLRVELGSAPESGVGSLADLPACGLWADRTDLGDTVSVAQSLRNRVEIREDRAR